MFFLFINFVFYFLCCPICEIKPEVRSILGVLKFWRRDGGIGYQSRGVCPNIFGRLPRLPVGAIMKIRPIKIEINGPGDSPREGYDKVVGSWRATDRHCTRSWPPRSRPRARGFNILIRFILKLLQVTIVLQITVQSAPRRGAYLPFSFPRP